MTYDNVFKAQQTPTTHHPTPKFRELKAKSQEPSHVDVEDVECRLIGQTVEDGVNSFLVELIDHSSRGLKPHNQVRVGVYPHPGLTEPINDQAETTVTADDFFDLGGVRKAFATVDVPGIMESSNAYLNIHVVSNGKDVDNLRADENTHYVTLLPAETVVGIEQLRKQEQPHTLHIERQEGGLQVRGLKSGDTLRVFSADGLLVYRAVVGHASERAIVGHASERAAATATSMFVPLSAHGVYLIGTVEEIVKYSY